MSTHSSHFLENASPGGTSSNLIYTLVALLVGLPVAWALFILSQPKIYQAAATLRIPSGSPTVVQASGGMVAVPALIGPEEVGTILAAIHGSTVLDPVAARLSGADLVQFMAPYSKAGTPVMAPVDLLRKNLSVSMRHGTFVIEVKYNHPDPQMAARVANLIAEEYLKFADQAAASSAGTSAPPAIRPTLLDRATPPSDAPVNPVRWLRR